MSGPQSRRDEQPVVSEDEFRSYYGRPVIKPPVWKTPDVPAYLYLGGMAGASAMSAGLAELAGHGRLRRVGRVTAAAGSSASVVALVHDLGRPARFLNMLRVFKPTSPLSVGSWILAPFSGVTAAAAGSELLGRLPRAGTLAAAVSAVLGPAMTTYTAVLLSDTAVPSWHEAYRELPFVFAGSALSSAGGVALLAVPPGRQVVPAVRMAVVGSVLELVSAHRMEHATGLPGKAYGRGWPGRVLRAAKVVTGVGAAAACFAGRSRSAAIGAGVCLTVAAAATRFGVFEAGNASARDPRYTVLPQRERLQRAEQDSGRVSAGPGPAGV